MKCHIPQISWHNRDPVLSVDFQPSRNGIRRVATAGTDTHVLIWLLNVQNDGTNVDLECVAELTRHSKTVNVVRFSPNGEVLASADDEAAIILWRHQPRVEGDIFADDDSVVNKENWTPLKVLRGHIDDICDLSWSPDSLYLVSGSVDNTAIMWDITKGKNTGILPEHKGFVQGVTWDPKGQYIATLCSDRSLRIFQITTKKLLYRVQKAVLPNSNNSNDSKEAAPKATRIFYDDTLKSYCRRLCFSPCGQLLIAPTGIIEETEGKFSNSTYVFTRNNLNKPALHLPTLDKFTLAVRCCPTLFQFRATPKSNSSSDTSAEVDSDEHSPIFRLPYRIVFAVATQDSILFYDCQQALPFAKVSNIHYTRLCDLSWSSDGRILMASSTDGYCSFVLFSENELGIPYQPEKQTKEQPQQNNKQCEQVLSSKEKSETEDFTLVLEADTVESMEEAKPKVVTNVFVTPDEAQLKDLSRKMSHAEIGENAKDNNSKKANANEKDRQEITNSSKKAENIEQSPAEDTRKSGEGKQQIIDGPSSSGNTQKNIAGEKGPRRVQLITLASSVNKS